MRRLSWMLVAVFALFFASCEKDVLGDGDKGEKVEIFFSINTSNYHTAPDVVRSGSVWEPDSRTIYLNENFYLRATLEPDAEEELRGDEPFIEGQKLCFAAFLTDGTQVETTAVYTYSTTTHKWVPDADPLGVTPDNVTEYRFVAYSYFDETGTPPLDVSVIDPSHDLVWGMSVDTKIVDETEAARTVSIHMTHQFARVKVVVKSSISGADITALSGVEIAGGKIATLTPFDGIGWSGSVAQVVDPFTVNSVTERESGYRMVTPVGAGPAGIRIGSIEVSASVSTFSNKWAYFNSALDAGTSYTLVVALVQGAVFADSNIFWDGEKLTFDIFDLGLDHRMYQGVYFKFGSLVGISPVSAFSSSTTVLYTPTEIITGAYSLYSEIPYWDDNSDVGDPDIDALKGDICKYINPGYRLPKMEEFPTGWSTHWNTHLSATCDDGTCPTWSYANHLNNPYLPCTGHMRSDGTAVYNPGTTRGLYWSASAHDATNGKAFYISSFEGIGPTYASRGGTATSVRCIRN